MKTNKFLLIAFLLSAFSINISAESIMGQTYFINDFSAFIPSSNLDVAENLPIDYGYNSTSSIVDGKLVMNLSGVFWGEPIYRNTFKGTYMRLPLTSCRKVELKITVEGFTSAPADFLILRFRPDSWTPYYDVTLAWTDGVAQELKFDLPTTNSSGFGNKLRWNRLTNFEIFPNSSPVGPGTITLEYLKIGEYLIPPTEIQTDAVNPINFDLTDIVLETTGTTKITTIQSFSATGLPNGVEISTAGLITGTPSPKLTEPVTAKVTMNYQANDGDVINAFVTENITFLPPKIVLSATETLQESPSLSPNPASDYVIIENALGKPVSIYTGLGAKVFETSQLNNETVSIANWAPGIYFIKVNETVLRLIKK